MASWSYFVFPVFMMQLENFKVISEILHPLKFCIVWKKKTKDFHGVKLWMSKMGDFENSHLIRGFLNFVRSWSKKMKNLFFYQKSCWLFLFFEAFFCSIDLRVTLGVLVFFCRQFYSLPELFVGREDNFSNVHKVAFF